MSDREGAGDDRSFGVRFWNEQEQPLAGANPETSLAIFEERPDLAPFPGQAIPAAIMLQPAVLPAPVQSVPRADPQSALSILQQRVN